ncbi:MAG: sigma-70 family RNA polymerase sigma factor [Deltaproteobacteria bacterium]|nr:sigma-70 family RNA polymerase sigma factor [Deltaproteobacteria bacterium]
MSASETPARRRERLLGQLVASSARRGFAVAFDLLGDRAEAEDAVQEALVRACRGLETLREDGAAEGWFMRTLVNQCLHVLRRRRVWSFVRGLWPGGTSTSTSVHEEPASETPGADEQLVQQVELARLHEVMARLPARQRVALVLRHGQGLPVAEVGELLGVGEGTVKTHLVRGLARLRRELGKGSGK